MSFHHRPAFTKWVLVLFAAALGFAIYEGPSLWWLAAYSAHLFFFSFGIGFGLHRLIAHHAYNPPVWVRNFATAIGVIAQGGSPMSWQTTHIMHHTQSDRDGDPHAPSKLGWWVIFGAADAVSKDFIIERALKDKGMRDPYLLFLHKYYYLPTAVYAIITAAFFGLHGLIYLAALPVGLSILSLGMLNYFAHRKNEARNVWWLYPLTFGENWHGNHHLHPSAQSSGPMDLIGISFKSLSDLFAKQDFPKARRS